MKNTYYLKKYLNKCLNYLGPDTVQVQPWNFYSEYLVMCFRLIIDMVLYMVEPWVFHDEILFKDAFS
jgi:hypothetical protein